MDSFPRWRRRQTLVNPEHQLRFTSVLLLQMTAVMLAIGAFAWMESRRTMELVLKHLSDLPGASHELHLNNQAFLLKVVLVIGVTGVQQIFFGIYTSHKLAGPLHKMGAVMERAARGEFRPGLSFRSSDQLEDLAGSVNAALAALSARQAHTRACAGEVRAALARLAEAPDEARARPALAELDRALAGLSAAAPPLGSGRDREA